MIKRDDSNFNSSHIRAKTISLKNNTFFGIQYRNSTLYVCVCVKLPLKDLNSDSYHLTTQTLILLNWPMAL